MFMQVSNDKALSSVIYDVCRYVLRRLESQDLAPLYPLGGCLVVCV
jgi:hypothetical protein